MRDLEYFINAFAQLRRAPGPVWTGAMRNLAPHKPFLLLSVIDLIAGGILKNSFIDTQQDLNELNELFVRYWRRLSQTLRSRMIFQIPSCETGH